MPHDPASPPPRFSDRRARSARQAISFLMQQAVENPQCLSLAAGLVDPATLPVAAVQDACKSLFGDENTARAALQYGTTQGSDRLRRHLVRHLARLEDRDESDPALDPARMILTTGSQQLLSLAGDVLLDPGDICLVAAPTYFVFLGTLAGLGAKAVPVATDEGGMRPDALETTLATLDAAGDLAKVKLIYVVSYYENPTGLSLAGDRRAAIAATARRWSRHHRLYVLEDAAYRELRYDGESPPSVWSCDPDRTLLAQTFSKSFSPGVRVGFGVVPPELVEPLCDRKGNEDFGSAHLNQSLLATVFEQDAYDEHVAALRDAYRRKRDAMLSAADEFFARLPGVRWVHPHGGLYVWMSLPPHVDTGFDGALFRRASRTDQVMYVPGDLCFAGPPQTIPRCHMRLSFGVLPPDGIREGMRRLSRTVTAVLDEGKE